MPFITQEVSGLRVVLWKNKKYTIELFLKKINSQLETIKRLEVNFKN